MKSYKFILVITISTLTIINCKKKIDPTPIVVTKTKSANSLINSWVYATMNDAYFWYNQMPSLTTLDSTISPTDFFENLIYQRANIDRFSDITPDINTLQAQFNGVNTVFGIRYTLGYTNASNTNIAMFLSNITSASPADVAGLKRGDIIMKINENLLTPANYQSLLQVANTETFTLGAFNAGLLSADDTKKVTLTRAEVAEDPVAFSSIIDKTAAGKKIGYLVYTQFIPGPTTGDTLKYDNELRKVFADFKSHGVNELVLDLRFNPGGYISSSTTLASLIVKNLSAKNVFYKDQYNDKYQAYFKQKYGANFSDNTFQAEPNNIGNNLNRVFILTSNGTASASELIINGLRPFMEVTTIGEHTYGKNLFGTLISDDLKRWHWGMYIMLGQTTNALGQSDYGNINGIASTISVADNLVPYKPFGDETETLLSQALLKIGVEPTKSNKNARTSQAMRFTQLGKEHISDNPKLNEKRMLVKFFPKKLKNNDD